MVHATLMKRSSLVHLVSNIFNKKIPFVSSCLQTHVHLPEHIHKKCHVYEAVASSKACQVHSRQTFRIKPTTSVPLNLGLQLELMYHHTIDQGV